MATQVGISFSTVYRGHEPYHKIFFSNSNSYFIANYGCYCYPNGILVLDATCSNFSSKHIIKLLCGCFEKDSDFNEKMKLILGEHTVKAIVIDIDGVPIMISQFNHNADKIYTIWSESHNK